MDPDCDPDAETDPESRLDFAAAVIEPPIRWPCFPFCITISLFLGILPVRSGPCASEAIMQESHSADRMG
jgi:hypothetical protein